MDIKNAIDAYSSALNKIQQGQAKTQISQESNETSFSDIVSQATKSTVDSLKEAEQQTMKAALGEANINDVVQAVTNAEIALSTVTAVRDKVIQAYQKIINMPV